MWISQDVGNMIDIIMAIKSTVMDISNNFRPEVNYPLYMNLNVF